MIKFIYFDLGGVVIDNHTAHKRIAKMAGSTPEQIADFFTANWKRACEGGMDSMTYMKLLKDTFNAPHLPSDFVSVLTDSQGFYKETHLLIEELAAEYKLGILSNAEFGVIDALFAKKKIPSVAWHAIVESAQYKLVKPDPKIYEIAEKLAGFAASELFFIDDLEHNVDAARARGWHGEVFDPQKPAESVNKIKRALHSHKK